MLEWVAYPFSRGSSQPGIKPESSVLQADSLLAELPGKPYIYMCVCVYIYLVIYKRIFFRFIFIIG